MTRWALQETLAATCLHASACRGGLEELDTCSGGGAAACTAHRSAPGCCCSFVSHRDEQSSFLPFACCHLTWPAAADVAAICRWPRTATQCLASQTAAGFRMMALQTASLGLEAVAAGALHCRSSTCQCHWHWQCPSTFGWQSRSLAILLVFHSCLYS